ncbi:uncharacterized protein LOC144655712 isoform X4 [Oculina patagonica]
MISIQFIVDRAIVYPSCQRSLNRNPSWLFAYIRTMKTIVILMLFSLACVFAGPYKEPIGMYRDKRFQPLQM